MSFNVGALYGKIRKMRDYRAQLIKEHEARLKEIDEEIAEEQKALDKLNELLEPYICKSCGGDGNESFTDAAGSRDWRKCRSCKGTGVNID